jgi:hypothetical protein
MALIDLELEARLKQIFGSIEKRLALRLRLEGGESILRDDTFPPGATEVEYKADQLIRPSAGIYNALKNVDEYTTLNRPAPGESINKIKKEMWREFSRQMSIEISKNIVDWLEKDVMPDLAKEINDQIKRADITINVHPDVTRDIIPVTQATPTGQQPAADLPGTPILPPSVKIE